MSDLLPTLASATGINLGPYLSKLDGVDQWEALKSEQVMEVRKSMLYNIDEEFGYSAYMEDGWKVVAGSTLNGKYDYWMGDFIEPMEKMNETFYTTLVTNSLVHQSMSDNTWLTPIQVLKRQTASEVDCRLTDNEERACDPLLDPCLFNLLDDPCEYNNLADQKNDILERLIANLNTYRLSALPIRNKGPDLSANPRFHNNTWTYWQEPKESPYKKRYPELLFLLCLSASVIVLLWVFGSIIKQIRKKSLGIPKMSKDGNINKATENKETSMNNNNNNTSAIEIDKVHL